MEPTGAETDELYVHRHSPLLGTVVEFRIRGDSEQTATRADEAMVAEIERLGRVFSVHDQQSELKRWQRGEGTPGPELTALLEESLAWQQLSGGAYNPSVGVLTERWNRAVVEGEPPDETELAELAASITHPAYRVVDGEVEVIGDVSTLSFNAFAKGRIADRALTVGLAVDGVSGLTVNAGGDLVHGGDGFVTVGVEDPFRRFDNTPPMTVVRLANAGLATSGTGRRGFRVAGQWYGHVLDPRTGRPVDRVVSSSVVAPNAATADVVATVLGVLPIEEGMAFGAARHGVGCLLVGSDGTVAVDQRWAQIERAGARREVRPSPRT